MKISTSSTAVSLLATAVLVSGTPSNPVNDSTPADRVVLVSDSALMAPQPPQLSEEEKQAIENKKAGRPYDEDAFNRAEQKRIQTEKYNKERNKQKRRK